MNVDSFLLSEYAFHDSGSKKLSVLNVFNRLVGPGPQWGMPVMYLSWVIHAHRDEAGEHMVEIRLVNAARQDLLPMPMKVAINIPPEQHPGLPLRHTGVYAMVGLVFKAPGPYAFEMYIDDVFSSGTNLFILRGPRAGG